MDFLNKFNIKFKDKYLLDTAFTHSSYANEHPKYPDYERLEYLGDAVLELVISEYFYLNTDLKEGEMTKHRAMYVCEKALATYAHKIQIVKYIKVGVGQKNKITDAIIADVFEAVIGAIFLDQGIEVVKNYIRKIIIPYIKKGINFNKDYKTLLQELVQTDKKSLEYVVIKEKGYAHDKTFEVVVKIGNIIYGKGIGKSKKEAEQKAAFDAYIKSAH